MNLTLTSRAPSGELCAIASKSAAHRLLICSAFANAPTRIRCETLNKDIEATVSCLCALGASIKRDGVYYTVEPIRALPPKAVLPCGESGSTLRFMLPIVAALGINAEFVLEGRLPDRPLSPLREELESHGITLSEQGSNPLVCKGKLTNNNFGIAGNVSSQFISGLLFALSLCMGVGSLTVTGPVESLPYIEMTCDALSAFGADIKNDNFVYSVSTPRGIVSPTEAVVEGDWSNAAFPLCAAAIGGEVTLTGISLSSRQGDKKIVKLLQKFGAIADISENSVRIAHSELFGIDIDASQIPDLVPVLATVAAVAKGTTRIYGAARLRIKESDRLLSVTQMLTAIGSDIRQTDDGLIINGKPELLGGTVDAANDHRIAMSAAVASVACKSEITIIGAEACAKSYPAFFEDMEKIFIAKKEITPA